MSEIKTTDWKETLNLPKTDFPMKAQLNQKEPQMLEKWDQAGIYDRILEKRKKCPPYILHDGPPYANGSIHLGTALNKILKDFVVKTKSMEGFRAPYVPGWDCHGLPIEHKVDQLLGEKKKGMAVIAIRKECRRYAEKFITIQRNEFKRLGVFGEWDKPYLTIDPAYESIILKFFESFVQKGNIYRKKRPVLWCLSCQTALAEAEVEYHDRTSPSITVKFLLQDIPLFLKAFSGKEIFVLIWTTTPWTIPANMAIALHPEYDYSLFQLNNEYLIAASRLVPVLADMVHAPYEKLAEFKGAELAGCRTIHPLYPRDSLIINTDYVLLDQGTGCVHTAPGHGEEDYQAGIKHGLDIYSPVGPAGRFDETTGVYSNQLVFDANPLIVEDLKKQHRLFFADRVEHSYPHCWRCKNPVIFRATEQWFIAMDTADLRPKALAEIKNVAWIPCWGEERISNMIANRPDWCISRQRDWGVPLPVFYCSQCQQPLLDVKVVRKVGKIFSQWGSNSWYEKDVTEFLPRGISCQGCGGKQFEKGRDILDVWFESGSSHGILQLYPGHQWPADMYLEGGDQYRGWFHSSLLVGISAKGKTPYRAVITHGWMLDHEGRAMSKSLGNVVEPQVIIKDKGAEILRLWAAMENYTEDMRLGDEILARVVESYRKIRNTWRFMLGVLSDYDPRIRPIKDDQLGELDRYILQRLQEVKAKILKAYREYQYYIIFHAISNFFTLDLSAFYLNVMKDNLYCNHPDSPNRRAAQSTIFKILRETLLLMAPILSFTTEEAWTFLPDFPGKEEFIHLELFPKVEKQYETIAEPEKWDSIFKVQERVLKEIEDARSQKKIGDSLEAEIDMDAGKEEIAMLKANASLLKEVLVVAKIDFRESADGQIRVRKSTGRKCPRCWNWFARDRIENENPELCPRCRIVVKELAVDSKR